MFIAPGVGGRLVAAADCRAGKRQRRRATAQIAVVY